MPRHPMTLTAAALLIAALAACSPSRMVANMAGNAMAGGGGTYASEEDPELVLEALPFGLKTMEGLIETAPDNANLRLAAARGFAGYAYVLQQLRADEAAGTTESRSAFDRRVSRLFLRGRDHAMAGLETRHPGFEAALKADRNAALAGTVPADAELLYWGGAAWSGAIAADKRDMGLVAGLPLAAAMVQRTAELDDAYDGGAAHEFLMLYEASRPGGSTEQAEVHHRRAIELSGGNSAGAHTGYAEAVAVARQDRAAFRQALAAALVVDLDAAPLRRLTNVLAQRKARRLLAEEPLLFIEAEGATS